MPALNYTETLVGNTPENVNKLNTILGEIRSVVNNLDDDNIGGTIDYAKILVANGAVAAEKVALPEGHVLIGNASGQAEGQAWSGAVDLSVAGATSLDVRTATDSGVAVALGDSEDVCELLNPPAGTWLPIVNFMLRAGGTLCEMDFSIRKNSVAIASGESRFSVASGQAEAWCSLHGPETSANGTDDFDLFVDLDGILGTIYNARLSLLRTA